MNDHPDGQPGQADQLAAMSTMLTRQLQLAGVNAGHAPALADDAIDYTRRTCAALGAEDPRCVTMTFNLGLLLVIRRIVFHGGNGDQDEAIGVLQDYLAALDPAAMPDDKHDVARVALGWLLVSRALRLPDPASVLRSPDMQVAMVSQMTGFSPGLAGARDIARAITVLDPVVANPAAPRDVRAAATVALAGATVLHGVLAPPDGADADPLTALSGLMQAVRSLEPDVPGRMELLGLHAWLSAEHIRTSGIIDTDGTAQRALEESAAQVTPGHMLHAVLELELGLSAAHRAQHFGGEHLSAAAAHATKAHTELTGWRDHPMYDDTLRVMSGTILTAAAWEPTPAAIEKAIGLAELLQKERDPADTAGMARDTYLKGMAHLLRAYRREQLADWETAASELRDALSQAAENDQLRPMMLATYAALLNDHSQLHGSLADGEAVQKLFHELSTILDQRAEDVAFSTSDVLIMTGIRGVCRVGLAWRTRDLRQLYRGEAEIERALAGLPDHYPWRSRLVAGQGMAMVATGFLRMDYARIQAGGTALAEAAEEMRIDKGSRLMFQAVGALAQVMNGRLKADENAIRQGIAILSDVAAAPGLNEEERLRVLVGLGNSHLIWHGLAGDSEQLDLGIARLEQASARSRDGDASPETATLLWGLAEAYHTRHEADDPEQAIEAGLAALRAHVYDVVLQREAGHSLVVAQGAAEHAVTVARWLHARGRHTAVIEALELGRGMVLMAATTSALLPEILVAAGHEAMAAQWLKGTRDASAGWETDQAAQAHAMNLILANDVLPADDLPGGLARQAIAILHEDEGFSRRLNPPGTDEIAMTLRASGTDALAYLVPGSEADPGLLIVVFADGDVVSLPAGDLRVRPGGPVLDYAEAGQALRRPRLGPELASPAGSRPAAAGPDALGPEDAPPDEHPWRAALNAVTEWAWPTAMNPLLGAVRQHRHDREAGAPLPRVVLVPAGILGTVPWHAAWTAEPGHDAHRGRTYACQQAVFTYAASARQFTDSACRTPLPPGSDAVFVADPTHSLPGAVFQTRALREHLYPDARGYGWTGEPGEDAGTPDQVLRHLPGPGHAGASLLQFSCHGVSVDTPMASYLDLAASASAPPGGDAAAGKLHVRRILQRAYSSRDLSAPGGLVVLAACVSDITPSDYDEALTLSTAFLAAGAVTVVGSRWEISDRVTPALMFMFHYFLRRESMTAADALQATQEWMLDPGRAVPPEMDPVIRDALRTHDCTDIAAWAAFIHQGR